MNLCIDYERYLIDAPRWFPSRLKIPNHYWDSMQMHMWSRMWFLLSFVFFWRGWAYR